MKNRFTGVLAAVISAITLPAAVLASPMVEIDSTEAHLGILIEGRATSAKHTFKLKNTGDSALVILNIKPG